jgi:RNA polymerase sigma-70 factor, ECF subfamily
MAGVHKNEQKLLSAYDAYADALFRHCYFRLYDREAAKDAVQDTYMRTWEYLADGGSIDTMRAFLYRVANNIVIDRVRKRVPLSLEDLQEKGFDPRGEEYGSRVSDIVTGREVLQVLHRLEDSHKAVVIMRYIDDLMPREIAAILGETENAVSVRIHRATKKVRDLWEAGVLYPNANTGSRVKNI